MPKLTLASDAFNRQGSFSLPIDGTPLTYNQISMGRPPITVTCDCGETKDVPYGERWECERCGRRWNTQQIPAEEYDGLLRRMRRFRLEVLGFAVLVAAVVIPLIVFVSASLIFTVPLIAAAWLFLYLPMWRRKTRRAARNAPRWELDPE